MTSPAATQTLSKLEMADTTTYAESNNDALASISSNLEPTIQRFNKLETKKLLLKLDLHLLPILALIYLLCFLDRTNIGNARLDHLEEDLGLKGLNYNTALAIFFPFYVLAEIPSNIIIKRVKPGAWLTFIMVSWAIVMICMGLVHNFSGLVACRVFLGLAEGGLFPGVNYYISMWYRRHECGFRVALFFSAATAAGAFGGLLARAITEMNGVGGKAGWSWIFILEGLLTLLVACSAFWFVHDYPAKATFLTTSERSEVERRLKADNHGLSDESRIQYVYQAFKDWKIWVNMLLTIGIFCPLYSISLFLPTILKELGYTNNSAQLMTVPPYVVACLCTIAGNFAADKFGQRGIFLIGFLLVSILGLVLLITSDKPHVQYAGTFLAASGIYPSVPLCTVWNSNNIGGSLKRAVGIAMQVGFGNLGGVISSFVYLAKDEPRFITGHSILLGMISMSLVLTTIMTLYLRTENARRDALFREKNLSLEGYTEQMKWEERENGDDALFFRYTV